MPRTTRRSVLAGGITASLGAKLGLSRRSDRETERQNRQVEQWDVGEVRVHGANYLPARAFNAYQMWRDYSPWITERDLGYAAELGLNAVRVFLSFEYWREDPEALDEAFDHLASAAVADDMRVVPVLFDTVGKAPTEQNLTDTNPLTATGVHSPSHEIVTNPSLWDVPRAFVEWFMERYRDDPRLLTIDVMNEPAVILDQNPNASFAIDRVKLARDLLETLNDHRGAVPLTIGTVLMNHVQYFLDAGLDVVHFHRNYPKSGNQLRQFLANAERKSKILDRPVWLSEWQRVRRGGTGWQGGTLSEDEWKPNYSTITYMLDGTVLGGDFFWSLMLKPAYLLPQRRHGTLNGVFHEDGAVWSLEDAQAIAEKAGVTSFDAPERQEWPEWAHSVKRTYLDDPGEGTDNEPED